MTVYSKIYAYTAMKKVIISGSYNIVCFFSKNNRSKSYVRSTERLDTIETNVIFFFILTIYYFSNIYSY